MLSSFRENADLKYAAALVSSGSGHCWGLWVSGGGVPEEPEVSGVMRVRRQLPAIVSASLCLHENVIFTPARSAWQRVHI